MLDNRLTVETPEQVGLSLSLAGIGSRLVAALIDTLCMSVLLLLAVLVPAAVSGLGKAAGQVARNFAEARPWTSDVDAMVMVFTLLATFVVMWGYYIIAETLMDGASPGKKALRLRVVREDGQAITFSQSVIRNLVRVIDFLPAVYATGLVTMFVSGREQRLGDLAAGTVVVHVPKRDELQRMPIPVAVRDDGLTATERALVQRYLERRWSLPPTARVELAARIARPLRQRLGDASTVDDDHWLASVAGLSHLP